PADRLHQETATTVILIRDTAGWLSGRRSGHPTSRLGGRLDGGCTGKVEFNLYHWRVFRIYLDLVGTIIVSGPGSYKIVSGNPGNGNRKISGQLRTIGIPDFLPCA